MCRVDYITLLFLCHRISLGCVLTYLVWSCVPSESVISYRIAAQNIVGAFPEHEHDVQKLHRHNSIS